MKTAFVFLFHGFSTPSFQTIKLYIPQRYSLPFIMENRAE
ncbi:hypothetical protein HMPREF0971_00662 [Segatella oris F0302]|uniref:Uncharacterized protein n=1 Tax=Segatella oris F0302 TaxID=649760 RepID=D1QNZ3_9BACT|nr:hypothetical protein HMPREF0971_00662 [Segatella oris F0302]